MARRTRRRCDITFKTNNVLNEQRMPGILYEKNPLLYKKDPPLGSSSRSWQSGRSVKSCMPVACLSRLGGSFDVPFTTPALYIPPRYYILPSLIQRGASWSRIFSCFARNAQRKRSERKTPLRSLSMANKRSVVPFSGHVSSRLSDMSRFSFIRESLFDCRSNNLTEQFCQF